MVKFLSKIHDIEPKLKNTKMDDINMDSNGDKVFDPPAEMMVHDYDDERTLDEEEALESTEDPQVELSNLQKEGDMPLEELLAMYKYGENENSDSEDMVSDTELNTDKEVKDPLQNDDVCIEDNGQETDATEEPSELVKLYTDLPSSVVDAGGTSRLLRSVSRPQSEEEEDDWDYSPDEEELKKTIMVGPSYQAKIPVGLCKYDDALPYENDDKMLWDPSHLTERHAEEFLKKAHDVPSTASSSGGYTRDDEQALYLLLQCGYNVDEALRRRRMNSIPISDAMSIWSEEECRNFETGMRIFGKDFHTIQKNKVRTRSVGELVQFYYLWKKTERHDVYANKTKLEKKKYALHPSITDYMDRFLEEQEVGSNYQDRSLSPHSGLYSYENKRNTQLNDVNDRLAPAVDPLANSPVHSGSDEKNTQINADPFSSSSATKNDLQSATIVQAKQATGEPSFKNSELKKE